MIRAGSVITSNGDVVVKETRGRVGFKDEHKDEHTQAIETHT